MSKPRKSNFLALIRNEVAPSLTDLPPAEVIADVAPVPEQAKPTTVASAKARGTLKQRCRQQSLYLEVPVYEVLRELSHAERTSLHALYLEGIDAVLRKRGQPLIKELVGKKAKPVL